VSDATVAERDEMLEDQTYAFVIVIHHTRESAIAEAAVDEDGGQPITLHSIQQGVAYLGGEDQESADLSVRERCDEIVAVSRCVGRVGHQAHESPTAQLDLNAGDQRAEQRISKVGDDHADKFRLLGAERCGDGIRQVAKLASDALDTLPGQLRHLPVDATQCSRDRSRMNTDLARDVRDRYGGAARHLRFEELSQTMASDLPVDFSVQTRIRLSHW
jgi:hypothetical protein